MYIYESPLGLLKIVEEDEKIVEISLVKEQVDSKKTKLINKVVKQLDEYFLGKRKVFDIPIKIKGTNFQQKVWDALTKIKYGTKKTYGQIAKEVGSPKGARAVGNACNKNKILIIIPCHRVVGSNNSLVGFALGIDKKEYLLNIEK